MSNSRQAPTKPSSSSTGFFQQRPQVHNQFHEDAGLRRVIQLCLPSPVQNSISPDLSRFGAVVLSRQILDWVGDSEKNIPYLRTWDSFGARKDELVTSEGWRRLQELGQTEGIVAIPYENKNGPYSRVHQFLKYHLWSASSAYVTCPSAMTDGAARLLSAHLANPSLPAPLRPVLTSALARLVSRDPSQAWTSGQWMTERTGGSDVSGTETVATKSTSQATSTGIDGAPLGDWSISGFKWFSSAADANMSILLARTPNTDGLSAFYAPMRRNVPSTKISSTVTSKLTPYSPQTQKTEGQSNINPPTRRTVSTFDSISSLLPYNPQRQDTPEALPSFYASSPSLSTADSFPTISNLLPYNPQTTSKLQVPEAEHQETQLNGVRIQRLKSKLGTRALPTAELELCGMRGYLLGTEGAGIKEISTVLNITRVHNAVTALGFWGRGLAVSRAFSRVRLVGGKRLTDVPAHVRTLAKMEVEYRGMLHLTFFTVLLLGISEQDTTKPALYHGPRSAALEKIMPSVADSRVLLRLLTPTIKALTAKAAIAGLSECMESMGGVGYLENEEMELNVARLARDVNVLSIWEGTTDVLAADLLKVLKGKQGTEILRVLAKWVSGAAADVITLRWKNWTDKVQNGTMELLNIEGRDIMFELGQLMAGVLLIVDCERDGDETAREVAGRWLTGVAVAPKTALALQVTWDKNIVFGAEGTPSSKL